MKILFLANSNSIHTKRWVISLAERDNEICLFSLEKNIGTDYINYSKIKLIHGEIKNTLNKNGQISKIAILKYLPKLRSIVKEFNPDLIHAHYATSYGLLGALLGFHPLVLSVWGSDIYDFPRISIIHNWMIKFNLSRADQLLSTSHVMACKTREYTKKEVLVTPFGIDLEKFGKIYVDNGYPSGTIVIGTVKTLSPKYGIDYLIQAFKIIRERKAELSLKLMIVGDGEDKIKLKTLCDELAISGDVIFTGSVQYDQVPLYLNKMDIYSALSTLDSESFGVAIIEASACEIPVVVSNVGGLPEVVEENKTGFIVESRNPKAAADAIEKLILDKGLRLAMGKAGRERVKELYNWDENVSLMINIYSRIIR